MQRAMQNDAAVFRTGETLSNGRQGDPRDQRQLRRREGFRPFAGVELRPDRDAGTAEPAGPGADHDRLSAENRTESRGAHAREDYPDRDDQNWHKHTVCSVDEAGNTRIDYRPVHMYTLSSDVEVVPPKPRVY